MNVIRSILISLFRGRSVKPSSRIPQGATIPVAVRTVSGLPRARVRRVKRSRLAAIIDAWLRTRVNTDEVEFLRGRLSVYQATTPRDLTAPIPRTEISDAGVFIVHDTDRRHPVDRIFDGPSDENLTPEAQFQRATAEVVGRSIADTAGALDADLGFVDRQLREVDAQLDRLTSERRDAGVAKTHLIESGRVDLAPPQFPSARSILFLRGCEALTLLAEASAAMLALLNATGLDPTALSQEWAGGSALAILSCAITAVVTASAAFFLAEHAVETLAAAFAEPPSQMRSARFWGAGITLTFVAAVVVTLAILRAQLGTAGQAGVVMTAFYMVLAAAPLLFGTYIHARAGALATARAAALRAVATPDRTDVAANLRRNQEEALRSERDRLLARRLELVAAIQMLNAGVFAGDELLRDKSRHETRVVDEWLDSVRAGLHVDQDAFRYFARRRGHEELLARPAAEPPGTLVPMMRKARRSA